MASMYYVQHFYSVILSQQSFLNVRLKNTHIMSSYLKRYQALITTTKQRNDDDLQRQQW